MELPPHPEPPKSRRFAYYLSIVTLLLAFLTALTFVYWTAQPTDVLKIEKKPTPAKYAVLNGNRVVDVTFDFCKKTKLDGQLSYSFVSRSTELLVPAVPAATPEGCRSDVHAVIPVPKQAVADTYHIHFKSEYKLNPIKTSVIEWDSDEFEVTP